MRNFLRKIVLKLAFALDLTNQLSPEEQVEFIKKEFSKSSLEERIKAIRTNSDFVPVYNKPKSYSDIAIMYQETPTSDFKPISDKTVLIERPQDFGNDIMAWRDAIHLQYQQDVVEKREKEKQQENMSNLIHTEFADSVMRKMMRFN